MISSRVLSLILAALFAAAFRPAPAAAQIGVAGEPKAEAKPVDEAKPKKKAAKADATKAAKPKKKKKEDDSKYKSRALAESTEASYHFDADGNPIEAAAKKKAAKAGKSSSDGSDEKRSKDACSAEEPCVNKSADADAL
jgi:hypothetical protein